MSGRTPPRLALIGLLAAALAAPAVAQEGKLQPPMPVPVAPQLAEPLPEAPMPRDAARSVCTSDIAALRQRAIDPANVPPAMNPPAPPGDQRQVFTFTVSLFGADEPATPPVPPMAPPAPPGPMPSESHPLQFGIFGRSESVTPATAAPCPACPTPGFWISDPAFALGSSRAVPAQPPVCVTPITSGVPMTWSAVFPVVGPVAGCAGCAGVKVIELTAVEGCPACPFPMAAANPLVGTWYRDAGVAVIAATFTHDEMKLCMSQCEDGTTMTITITAHYTLTKDGLVYGAVTGADVDVKQAGKAAGIGMEFAELSMLLQELTDRPFSFRAKMTSAGLMVSQLKAASFEGTGGRDFMVLGGLYKPAKDGKVPAPTPTKSVSIGGKCDAAPNTDAPIYSPMAPPLMQSAPAVLSEPIQRVGIDFSTSPPTMIAPCPIAAPPACDDPMKSMAADAFGQMLRAAAPPQYIGGMTLPSPRYLEHYPQYFAPDPCYAERPVQAANATAPTPVGATPAGVKPGATGTWVREIGSKQCVVKIEADHFTVTLSEAHEFDGKVATEHLTLTADYQMTRDGLTAVGLITSVDLKLDGELSEDDMSGVMESIREMQKALEDKPFALTLRRYGEALVIGNVRMPSVGDAADADPASFVGGRYARAGDKPLPKLKPVKATEPRPLPAYVPPPPLVNVPGGFGPGFVPPGAFGQPLPPGFVPPGLVCPAPYVAPPLGAPGDLLPPQSVPVPGPAPARPIGLVAPAPQPAEVPSMAEPTPPAPTMPQPVPPGVSDDEPKPEPARPGKKKQKYSSDPNVRIQQLLNESEDLRQINNEWRRFWFSDQPSRLTPERVHSGIN